MNTRVPAEERLTPALGDRQVTWDDFNPDSLAAAIFAETNRMRAAHGVPMLRSHVGLREAATFQASAIMMTGVTSHENPFLGMTDVVDRVRATGVPVGGIWENVASTLVRRPKEGRAVRTTVDAAGRREQVDLRTGEPLSWPTYQELATRIVRQWMDSPGHRANLLRKLPTHLACSTVIGRTPLGGEVVHSVQVFIKKR